MLIQSNRSTQIGVHIISLLNSPVVLNDPNGKWVERTVKRYDVNGKLIPPYKFWVRAVTIEVSITIHNAKIYNGSSIEASPDVMRKAADNIQADIEKNLSKPAHGKQSVYTTVKFAEPIEIVNNLDDVKMEGPKSDNLIYIADPLAVQKATDDNDAIAYVPRLGSNLIVLDIDAAGLRGNEPTTPAHEELHQLGADHNENDLKV